MLKQDPAHFVCQPQAEKMLLDILDEAMEKNSHIGELDTLLQEKTSCRLFDFLDHVSIGSYEGIERELCGAGFHQEVAHPSYRVFVHPGAKLPKVVLKDRAQTIDGIAVKVESIAEYLMVRGIGGHIEGTPYSPYRRCLISADNDVSLYVVERRSTESMEPIEEEPLCARKYILALEKWMTRPRGMDDEDEAMRLTLHLAEEIIRDVGQDLAAWIVLEGERRFWQAKNHAGQLQKNRQDSLGMGWANHDHHTFRSSRKQFHLLVRLFEMLGFHLRERFYAGKEAGWGAQVVENERAGLVCFLDVDLDEEELDFDFAHGGLREREKLGTIGLWCALHGDSILAAGMHHLEAQFMFEKLREDLHERGVAMMDPFSNFSYLKQAFTRGEMWSVSPYRVKRLLHEGKITHEEADRFLKHGALGSHLENLERKEGYKGFNKKNVSSIIRKTDPRSQDDIAF